MKKVTFLLWILAGLVFSPVFLQAQTNKITLDDIWAKRTFSPKGVYGLNPLKDGEHYSVLENDSINIYSYETGERTGTLAVRADMKPEGDTLPIRLYSYSLSADEKKILIPTNTDYIYRYSSASDFYIFDLNTHKLSSLSDEGKQRLADFSPDGTKIAYVRDNNIFIKDYSTNIEYKITNDGKKNNIINGTTDWVYEEEFAITKGFSWSPDGKRIAFFHFDESKVKEYSFTEWGDLYPKDYTYKYPVAGEDNSIVNVYIYDLSNQQTVKVDVGPETDQYIPRFFWTKDPSKLAVIRMNRLQNRLDILMADVDSGKSRVIYTESNKYYIEDSNLDHFIFINKDQYLMTSEKSGNYHIYLNNIDGSESKQLTKGYWDVNDVYGYDENEGLVYFSAAASSPANRDLYSVSLKGKMKEISRTEGTHSPEFSKNYTYYIDNFNDANTPPVFTVNQSKGKVIRTLESNSGLIKKIQDYNFSKVEFFDITTSEHVNLKAWKILPPNFDPSKKYPVLMYVYGGPGSQTVLNAWGYSQFIWFEMLAQEGYIIVSVDNRGTGNRGEEFKKMTYLQLGKYETIDQIESNKYLRTLPYVDSTRIGIWGWSYGGFMSSLCILKGADYFKSAIAVAPVTNWRYYDNIYTERFMRKPQDNPSGYDDNSPINFTDKLKGKFLLVHGTGDDNVHLQNSMDLITALHKSNKQFELMLYPNKNHGIYGGNTRLNLFTRLTDFLNQNL